MWPNGAKTAPSQPNQGETACGWSYGARPEERRDQHRSTNGLAYVAPRAVVLSRKLAAGDVGAAFPNGIESNGGLYFEPKRRGFPGVKPCSLVEIVGGVFGLSNSPRLWWDKLVTELLALKINAGVDFSTFSHHELDPYFFLRDEMGKTTWCPRHPRRRPLGGSSSFGDGSTTARTFSHLHRCRVGGRPL